MRAQLTGIRRTTRSQNHIANKLRAARTAFPRHNRPLRHAPIPQKPTPAPPKPNAKTANLNLPAPTTHKLQNSTPTPARQVPAAVHPTTRSAKPIRNKALRRQGPTTQIAPRNARPRNVKLPNNPNRHRLQTTIQNVHAQIGNATPDETPTAGGRKLLVEHKVSDMHRRLGDPIHIDERRTAVQTMLIPMLKSPEV